jgi:DegV family protein with EDD domain
MTGDSQGLVAVATDSSACLPRELADAWGVLVAPLQVIIDDEAFDEGSGIAPHTVVESLLAGRKVSTSQPGPAALAAVAERAAANGATHLVFVSLSGDISGTAAAMEAAAASAPLPVTVVDTRTVSLAAGLAAVSAAAVARAGGTPDEVVAEAYRAARSSLCLFTVDTLEYLRRGGRISDTTAALGNALGVKPVLGVIDGRVDQIERVRTSSKARESVLAKIAAHAQTLERPVVGLMTLAGDEDMAADARAAVAAKGEWPVIRAGLSAVLAAHGGPGSLAAAVVDVHPSVGATLA